MLGAGWQAGWLLACTAKQCLAPPRPATATAHLLAGPQRARLEDGGHGDLAVPVLDPQQDIHEQVLLHEGVALGEQPAAQQCVLHDAHHRLVALQGARQALAQR